MIVPTHHPYRLFKSDARPALCRQPRGNELPMKNAERICYNPLDICTIMSAA